MQSIELVAEAERLGMDGACFRVHHFAQQLASPFPLLAAVGAKTRKIEIGTAVIDMRMVIAAGQRLATRISTPLFLPSRELRSGRPECRYR
ncbi:MAG: LLM class flavin-dependent oxidoreductase [Terracidiphilus sp.]